MSDPRTFWLVVTNIVLGAAVVLLILGLATGVLCELVVKLKKRHSAWAELDRDMQRMFGVLPLPKRHHRSEPRP
jgi:hypothetical protein